MSMNFLPGHVITNNYFDKKRGIAGGIVCSGAGFGIFILAPILQFLMEEYGWRGTMLITAGIFMQLCACSTLLRPLSTQKARSGKCDINLDKDDENDPMILNKPNEVLTLSDIQERSDVKIMEPFLYQNDMNIEEEKDNVEHTKPTQKHIFKTITLLDRSASADTLAIKQKLVNKDLSIAYAISSLQNIPSVKPVSQMEHFLRNSQFLHPDVVLAKSQQMINDNESTSEPDLNSNAKYKRGKIRICNSKSCDLSMLRNKTFIPLLLGGILIQMGQFIPNMFIPDYCFSIGLDGTQMSIIISLYGMFTLSLVLNILIYGIGSKFIILE